MEIMYVCVSDLSWVLGRKKQHSLVFFVKKEGKNEEIKIRSSNTFWRAKQRPPRAFSAHFGPETCIITSCNSKIDKDINVLLQNPLPTVASTPAGCA